MTDYSKLRIDFNRAKALMNHFEKMIPLSRDKKEHEYRINQHRRWRDEYNKLKTQLQEWKQQENTQ